MMTFPPEKWCIFHERCGRKVLNRKKHHISDFYFSSYVENSSKIDYILSTKMTITRKNLKIYFHSFQHIPHISCKFNHFWKKDSMKIFTQLEKKISSVFCMHQNKNKFKKSYISFFSIFRVMVNFRWIFIITRKIKIGKIWFFFRFSTFPIFHEICITSEGRGSAYSSLG